MTSSAVASILRVVLRRFPLVPRPQPGCPPLPDRVRRVAELAAGTGPTGPSRIAAAHNLAALIAADCGHPDLARDLSWRHHHRYPTDRAWSDRQTRLALEPLINSPGSPPASANRTSRSRSCTTC